jgi:hypothetical protein
MDKKIFKIIELLHAIQKNSEFKVSYSFYGHTQTLDVDIVEFRPNRAFIRVFDTTCCAWHEYVNMEFVLQKLKEFCKNNDLNVGGNNE